MDSKKIIHVIATQECKEGKRDAFLAEFHKVQPKVLAEVGCIQYEPAVDIQSAIPIQQPVRNNHVAIIEKWESLEALYAHLQAPHMKEFFAATSEFTNGMDLRILESHKL